MIVGYGLERGSVHSIPVTLQRELQYHELERERKGEASFASSMSLIRLYGNDLTPTRLIPSSFVSYLKSAVVGLRMSCVEMKTGLFYRV